jgi:hypothetical protein
MVSIVNSVHSVNLSHAAMESAWLVNALRVLAIRPGAARECVATVMINVNLSIAIKDYVLQRIHVILVRYLFFQSVMVYSATLKELNALHQIVSEIFVLLIRPAQPTPQLLRVNAKQLLA